MAGNLTVRTEISGLNGLRRVLRGNDLYAKPWADGMEELRRLGAAAGRAGSPKLSGKLEGTVVGRVQKRPFPMWVAVRVGARKKGYPYPRLLAFSLKHGHLNWLLRAVMPVWQNAERTLSKIGQQIAERWERGR